MLDFAKIAKESHKTALDKGWWPTDADGKIIQRDVGEIYGLFHSEVSEAVEEIRDPHVARRPTGIYFPNLASCLIENWEELQYIKGIVQKPEGVAVELADLIIRIGDSVEAWGATQDVALDIQGISYMNGWLLTKAGGVNPIRAMTELHSRISDAYKSTLMLVYPEKVAILEIAKIILLTEAICKHYNWDLELAIKIKLAYNKTRPYRHGGKTA
jgi:hypothetical protein